MARLPQSGSAISSLYERPAAFDEMIFEHLIILFLIGLASQDEIKKAFDEIVKSFAELGLTTTLSEVICDLGLAPLSTDDEQKARDDLQAIIGRWVQEDARLQIPRLQTKLRRVTRTLTAHRDQAIALEVYTRQAHNTEAERKACEIRLRAERKAGKLLKQMEKAKGGGDQKIGSPVKSSDR